MSILLAYMLLVVQAHGFQIQKQNDLHGIQKNYLISSAHWSSTQLYFKSEEKVATTMSSAWLKTEKKKKNEITLINLLYNVLLVEPIFGSLGLIKSSEPAFEDKLASIKSLVLTTAEVAVPPNVVSVTTEPPKIKKSPKIISESDSIIASSVSNKNSKTKKSDFKDEVWVVRKLKEIRARENEVITAATKPSPIATPTVTTSATVDSSSTTKNTMKTSTASVPVPMKSTSDTTRDATSTAAIASSTPATPLPLSVSTPIIAPTPEATSAPTTTMLLQNAMSSALSSFMPTTLSSSENKPELESTTPTAAVVVVTNVPIINNEKTTVLLAPKPMRIEQKVTTSAVIEKSETSSDLFFPLDMDQIGKSVINQGIEYGPVDKLATEFSINSDTFKLPKISIETESSVDFINAKNVIKTAGLSGTIAYAISEVGFWAISVPIIVSSYHSSTNEWLDINDSTDRTIIFGLSAGFTSAARLALPLRIAIAAGLTPLVDKFITKPFILKEDNNDSSGVVKKNIASIFNSKTATISTIAKPNSSNIPISLTTEPVTAAVTAEKQGFRSRVVSAVTSPFRIVKDRLTRQQPK